MQPSIEEQLIIIDSVLKKKDEILPIHNKKKHKRHFKKLKKRVNPIITRYSKGFYASDEWMQIKKDMKLHFEWRCMNRRCRDRKYIQVDHVVPFSKNFELRNNYTNLQLLCKNCNKWKGTRTIDYRSKNIKDKLEKIQNVKNNSKHR